MKADDEPVIMRVCFQEGTSAALISELVSEYPFTSLRGNPLVFPAEDGGLRLLFQRPPSDDDDDDQPRVDDDSELVFDGGVRFSIVPVDEKGRGPFLDISRLNEGRKGLPAVIREKQVCKKMVEKLQQHDSFASSRIRAFGSGSF